VYSREVEGSELSFGVSGKLWHGVLVMYDRETESFWTQLDGRSIQGPEQGQALEHYPSVFTTWAAWLEAHPNTLVLDKAEEEKQQSASNYAGYFSDPDRLFLPHLSEGLGDEAAPKEVVFGVKRNGDALAVTESMLIELRVVNTEVGGEPIAFLRNEVTGGVRAVFRKTKDGVLELDVLPDDETSTRVLDLESGEEIDTRKLTAVRVDRAFYYAWGRMNPDSRVETLE
jgi:hypothetical protein